MMKLSELYERVVNVVGQIFTSNNNDPLIDEDYLIKPSVSKDEISFDETKEKIKVENAAVNNKRPCKKHGYAKVNTKNKYLYFSARDKQYFKTERGKRPILITSQEAVNIIKLSKKGMSASEIVDIMDFKRPINYRAVHNWIQKYNLGLMDKALFWICKNDVGVAGQNVREVLHSYVGDL